MYEIANIKKTRTKTTWQAGDYVIITLVDDSDPENAQTKDFRYTYTDEQAPKEFRAMVKAEITAHLAHLNSTEVFHDVTAALSL